MCSLRLRNRRETLQEVSNTMFYKFVRINKTLPDNTPRGMTPILSHPIHSDYHVESVFPIFYANDCFF